MVETNAKIFLRSHELAATAGVSTDTLRHYERKGVLIKPRRSRNGYREYPIESVERINLVRKALLVGFTLDELAKIFQQREKGGTPCQEVYQLAVEKVETLEVHLQELILVYETLKGLVKDWRKLLSETKQGEKANLLSALVATDPKSKNNPKLNWRRRKGKTSSATTGVKL